MGAGQQGDCQFVVVRLVQLEESRGFAVRSTNILDRLAAGGGEAVGQVELFGDFGDGQLAGGVVDFVDAYGGEADGRGDFVAEDFGGGVTRVGVDEHSWDYAVAVEGLAVGEVGGGHAGVGRGVVPAAFGEALFGAVFEFAGVLMVLVVMAWLWFHVEVVFNYRC